MHLVYVLYIIMYIHVYTHVCLALLHVKVCKRLRIDQIYRDREPLPSLTLFKRPLNVCCSHTKLVMKWSMSIHYAAIYSLSCM